VKKLLLLGSAIAAGVLIKRLLETPPDARSGRPMPLLGSGTEAVFGIVRAADEDEALALIARFDEHQIDCAELALERELDSASLGLAERLRKEHGDHLDETRARREERGSEDEQYGAVEAFDVHCRDRLAELREIAEDEFAESYVERVAAEHEAMIEAIDEALLPASDDATVRELLQRHRQHLAMHLADARLLH
jgi:putative membrane protein